MSTTRNALVIGAGVAGLAASVRLALQGFSVDVLEQNPYPGGKLSSFSRDGYSFDAGPSLFTQPGNIRDLFQAAGKRVEDYFRYVSVPLANQYFFPDGKVVRAFTDPEAFASEMHTVLGEDPDAVRQYLREAGRMYDRIGRIFLDYSLHRSSTWWHKRIFPAFAALRPGYLIRNLDRHNRARFRSKEAIQIFNRFATYNGSSPYRTPAMLSMIPHLEMNEGTFYPLGGMVSITNAIHRLAEDLGVRFHFSTPAQRILHSGNRVQGAIAGDREWRAGLVVSNVDVYFTYKRLLGDDQTAQRVLRQERSSSAVIFYWGIGRTFDRLGLHNILFTGDYQREFAGLFGDASMSDDPTIYINITSKMEAGLAPEGKENWFVMVNAPAHRGQDWPAIRNRLREKVLDKISRTLGTDVRAHLETEDVLDPPGIESKTSSYMGSLYGTSSNSLFAAFLRHPNFRSKASGLYFCGGSVHPGGGIPLCLKSAQIVSNLVTADGF